MATLVFLAVLAVLAALAVIPPLPGWRAPDEAPRRGRGGRRREDAGDGRLIDPGQCRVDSAMVNSSEPDGGFLWLDRRGGDIAEVDRNGHGELAFGRVDMGRAEAFLVAQLLAGHLTAGEYRGEMASLAACDALSHPLVVPPEVGG